MHLKETLIKWLKLIGVDIRQALIGSVFLGIAAAYGGLLYISKELLNYTILFLTTPTPLWATISLVLLGCLYTYIKSQRSIPLQPPTPIPSAKSIIRTDDVEYENLIWTASKYSDGSIFVKEVPRCKDHDYELTFDGKTYHCLNNIDNKCIIKLSQEALTRFRRWATVYIEKYFRDNPLPRPTPPSTRPRSNWVTGWRR